VIRVLLGEKGMPYRTPDSGKPVQARPTLPRRSKTKIGSATPKFAHIEKWETAVAYPWTRLLSIHGQYNICHNLREYCTGFVLLISAPGASTRICGLFAPHLHPKVGQVQKGVFKTIASTPSPPTPVTCSGVTAARPGHVNAWDMGLLRMQRFGILDSGSPLGKGVTSLPRSGAHGSFPTSLPGSLRLVFPMESGRPAGSPLKNCGRLVHGVPRVQDARNAAWDRVRGVHGYSPLFRRRCVVDLSLVNVQGRLPLDPDTTKCRLIHTQKFNSVCLAHKS